MPVAEPYVHCAGVALSVAWLMSPTLRSSKWRVMAMPLMAFPSQTGTKRAAIC